MSRSENKIDYSEITVSSEEHFYKLRKALRDVTNTLYYRGQSNANWEIKSSLERLVEQRIKDGGNKSNKRVIEMVYFFVLRDIQSKIFNYNVEFKIADNDDFAEWNALIQHYGGATRLIDFTSSFYVALHFAVPRNASKSEADAAIWIVNYFKRNKAKIMPILEQRFSSNDLHNKIFRQFILPSPVFHENEIFTLSPEIISKRMQRQAGIFLYGANYENTFFGNVFNVDTNDVKDIIEDPKRVTLDDMGAEDLNKLIAECKATKLIISKEMFPFVLLELSAMNLTTEQLFPDFEGLIKASSGKV